jgi:23S rRNA pseudouridine1911/1915/1917 synthase
MRRLEILYEDNHLLVVNKPAGIATMGTEHGESAHSLAVDYLRRKYDKPGRVYLGVVSRLDRVTSGVLVLARTSKAASRLVPQFGQTGRRSDRKYGRALKLYLAVVEGRLPDDAGEWTCGVRKDDAARRMRVVPMSDPEAAEARLRFGTLRRGPDATLAAVQLLTGRKHQIRIQFADAGHPVWGDRKYGSRQPFPLGVALHCWQVQITHPTQKVSIGFDVEPPTTWDRFATITADLEADWKRIAASLRGSGGQPR